MCAGLRLHVLFAIVLCAALSASPVVQAACAASTSTPPPACGTNTAACQCLTTVAASCHPTDILLEAFLARGACPAFGAPLTPVRPRLSVGGRYQEFENGEIATYSTWTRDASAVTPDFVLSAFRQGKSIEVEWGSTKPFEYDFFILRWDRDDHPENVGAQHEDDAQQLDVKISGDRGKATIDASAEGTYVIYVEGCKEGGFPFGGNDCDQGWSHPVYVDHLPVLADPAPLAAQPPPVIPQGILDVPDSVMLTSDQFRPIVEALCKGALRDSEGDHEGEIATTAVLANLEIAKRGWTCDGKQPAEILAAVNAAIRDAVVVSQPGTDVSGFVRTLVAAGAGAGIGAVLGALGGPLGALVGGILGGLFGGFVLKDPPGDYDMRLTGLIQIAYRFPAQLEDSTRKKLIEELLTVRGGADERKDFVWISGVPTPVLETENHVWMTESARYLTNNLIAAEYEKRGEPVPKEFDNDANGMTAWMLESLRLFLIEDFYELNSRPYAHHVVQPIQNLADFAAYGVSNCAQVVPQGAPRPSSRCDVRRAARNVLDFLAAKFALSSNELRRAAPFRRQPPFRHYPRLWTTGGDDMTWRYLSYTGGSDLLREERHRRLMEGARGEVLTTVQSYYRPPVMLTDLIRSPATSAFYPLQRFRSTRREADTVEIYYRHPEFLISAGGMHDDGTGVAYFFADEDAWALPTTLMPTKQGADYRDFVRIAGHVEDDERVNTCVAPGFACGMNPTLPAGLPESCKRVEGNWTFVDFTANTAECPFGFGFFVALYQERCTDSDCQNAGGMSPLPSTFGFFEATPYRSFDAYVKDVLALNGGWDYRYDKVNVYQRPLGGRITFVLNHDRHEWGIVDYETGAGLVKPERDLRKWPVADGDVMTAPLEGCIVVDNRKLKQRLILDHTDVKRPRRTIVELPGRECRCPLPDYCIGPRAE